MTWKVRAFAYLRVVTVATVVVLGLLPDGAAQAQGSAQPGAMIVDPVSLKVLSGPQSSTTMFAVLLPSGAHCSHSTASSGYHVQSFLVDVARSPNPATYTYGSAGPAQGLVLWTAQGTRYDNENTNIDSTIPSPLPTFSWSHFYARYHLHGQTSASSLYAGTWNLGISCSDAGNDADNFWNVSVTIRDSATDPHQFTWESATGAGAAASTPVSGSSPGLATTATGGVTTTVPPSGDASVATTGSGSGAAASGTLATTGSATSRLLRLAFFLIVVGGILFEMARHLPAREDLEAPDTH